MYVYCVSEEIPLENKKKRSLSQNFSLIRGMLPYFKPYIGVMALDLFCR